MSSPSASARQRLRACLAAAVLSVLVCTGSLAVGSGGLFLYEYLEECCGPRLVCLLYHRFVSDEEFRRLDSGQRLYATPVRRFEAQLRHLRDEGYYTPSVAEALAFARGENELPEKSVLITIDDGYRCALAHAEPLLKKYGFRAALFITTDPRAGVFRHAGHEPLSAGELGRLDPRVFEVFAHGVSHRPMSDLGDVELRRELLQSRLTLEGTLHRPVRCMAVPGNRYDARVLAFAARAGYEAVFTSEPGSIQPGCDVHRLPRWNVAGDVSLSRFSEMLRPMAMATRRFFWALSHGL